MFKRACIVLTLVLAAATVWAEEAPVSFSSSYTYLSKECKWAYKESELSEGQDNALVCKGVGKYEIFIYFSAEDTLLGIRLKGKPETVYLDPAIAGIDEKKGVVEWRLANGAPFAVIVRSREYSGHGEERKPVKESLVVRGFDKYSAVGGLVNVKNNKNANEDARKLADEGYKAKPRGSRR